MFFVDVSGQLFGTIFKGQADQEDYLTLEGGIDRLSRNIGNRLPIYTAQHVGRAKTSTDTPACSKVHFNSFIKTLIHFSNELLVGIIMLVQMNLELNTVS
jgi:hypothetical protein